MQLTSSEWSMLIESMRYTVHAFEGYRDYPSFEFKRQRIKEAADLLAKLRMMRKEELSGQPTTSSD